MGARELVTAVLCRPISGKELLQTEKENNVVIHRNIQYDKQQGSAAFADYLHKLMKGPLKLLFIFGTCDSILVDTPEAMHSAMNRLLSLG
jgi:hypothetical protein